MGLPSAVEFGGPGVFKVGSSVAKTGNNSSAYPAISASGRVVAFASIASNLVPGTSNHWWRIFVRDRVAHRTERVDVSSAGAPATGDADPFVAISADGRFVAFTSRSPNLVAGATSGHLNVFVRDRWARTTELVSVGRQRAQANASSLGQSISANGRYVAFASDASNLVANDTNDTGDVFVRDRRARKTVRVSVAGDGAQAESSLSGSDHPAISADGRYVAFTSGAPNLVANDTNGCGDVFVRDLIAGTTERVSVSSDGEQSRGCSWGPSISANGRFVAFVSDPNLVGDPKFDYYSVYVHDRVTGNTELDQALE